MEVFKSKVNSANFKEYTLRFKAQITGKIVLMFLK